MSARVSLQKRIDNYLAERRGLGFELRSRDTLLASFARYVTSLNHRGPLTADLMTDWARQDKRQRDTPATWAARLAIVRHFARYLKQFEAGTEIPEEPVFGPERARVAPHIFYEEEVVALLAGARRLGPKGSLRPATYETLFGLMASTGLRISEAIHLRDADVDLKRGMLTVRQTKFCKVTTVAHPFKHGCRVSAIPASARTASIHKFRAAIPYQQPWAAAGATSWRATGSSCF